MNFVNDLPPNLLVQKIPGRRTVSAGIWIAHGAAHDEADLAGVTHLVEHLTLRRCGTHSRRELAMLVDRLGGEVDAWTSSETMGISIQTTTDALSDALSLLVDAILTPTFDEDDIDLEKRVALVEMDLVEDDPDEQVEDALLRAAWGGHALARPIIGFRSTLGGLGQEDVRRHHRRLIQPGRVLAAVAGDIEANDVARALAPLPLDTKLNFPGLPALVWHGGREYIVRQGIDQVHARLAFPALPINDPSVPALVIFNRVLGVGASSRLFQRLREDVGLTYDVWSGLVLRSLGGLLEVGWACAPSNLSEVWRLVREELETVLTNLGPEEVEVAKEGLQQGLLMEADTVGGRCSLDVGENIDHQRRFDFERISEEYRSISFDSVLEIGRRVVDFSVMAVAQCGPEGQEGSGDCCDDGV